MKKTALLILITGAVFASNASADLLGAVDFSESISDTTLMFMSILGFLIVALGLNHIQQLLGNASIDKQYNELYPDDLRREYSGSKEARKAKIRDYKKRKIEIKKNKHEEKISIHKQKKLERQQKGKERREKFPHLYGANRNNNFDLKRVLLEQHHYGKYVDFSNQTYEEYKAKQSAYIEKKVDQYMNRSKPLTPFEREQAEMKKRQKEMDDRRNAEWEKLPDPTPSQQREINDRNNRRIARDNQDSSDSYLQRYSDISDKELRHVTAYYAMSESEKDAHANRKLDF